MTKPDRREHNPSDELARFTDRRDQRSRFQFHLNLRRSIQCFEAALRVRTE